MISSSPNTSDKFYWHGYIPFYESFFKNITFENIAEFGVFKGDSIRWLLNRFPTSNIYGADILSRQDYWPTDPRFFFEQLDQADRQQVRSFITKKSFDLIIEDGSHIPEHQVNCLIEGMRALNGSGIYILEDVQTSLPHHPMHQRKKGLFKQRAPFNRIPGNALSVLLAIDHFKRIQETITLDIASEIAKNSLFTASEVMELAKNIHSINLYRRTHLPDYCHQCKSDRFEYSSYTCICGQPVFSDTDSMTFVIIKQANNSL